MRSGRIARVTFTRSRNESSPLPPGIRLSPRNDGKSHEDVTMGLENEFSRPVLAFAS